MCVCPVCVCVCVCVPCVCVSVCVCVPCLSVCVHAHVCEFTCRHMWLVPACTQTPCCCATLPLGLINPECLPNSIISHSLAGNLETVVSLDHLILNHSTHTHSTLMHMYTYTHLKVFTSIPLHLTPPTIYLGGC